MITLKDVAKEAGVSIATVSCALSGKKPVKAETKARIQDVIERLKYIPNISARNLKVNHSRSIGIILIDIKNQLHAEIFDGLSTYFQNQEYTIHVAFSNGSPDIECSKIEEFISQNVAGLVIVTCQPQNATFFQTRILDYQIPVVFLDHCPQNLSTSFLGFQNYQTSYYLTKSLLDKGYQNIALICGPKKYSSQTESIQGLCDAMAFYGLELPKSNVCVTNMTKEDGFNGYLRHFSRRPPQALISTSQEISAGILAAIHYCGLSVPENLLLLGYGEESWNHIQQIPGIFVSSRPAVHLGETAARILLKNIEEPALFEPVYQEFKDEVVENTLDFPQADQLKPPVFCPGKQELKLKFLLVDSPSTNALQLLSDYFTRETGIPIEFTRVAQDQLFQMINSSIEILTDTYDMYTYDVPWLDYMVQNLCLADITDFVSSPSFQKERLFKGNLANCQFEQRFYGIPIIGGTQILFYRKDLFENRDLIKSFKKQYQISLRPPRTWKEFNAIASFFTQSKNPDSPTEYGTSFAGVIDEEMAPEILIRLWAFGGRLWDNYNRPTFNTPANHNAFESLINTLSYIPPDPFKTSITQTVEDFSNGKTAMLITYSEYAQQISQDLKTNIIGRVGFHMIPGRRPASVGWNIGLNPFSHKQEAAFRFLNWVCERNTSFYLTILNAASPVKAPFKNHELLKLYPWLAYTEQSINNSMRRNGPYKKNTLIIPQNQIESILCNALRRVVQDGISIPEALEEGQKLEEHLFRAYGYPLTQHFL